MLRSSAITILLVSLVVIFSSCDREDPGPLQEKRKSYSVVDFDRLDIGSALNIQVEQGNVYSVEAKGDRRNIDDLEVSKHGNTLSIRFDDEGERRHDTYIYITMPSLSSANFSGASSSKIRGFDSTDDLDLYLSGASVSQLDASYSNVNTTATGASKLVLFGSAVKLNAELSGASSIKAFDFHVNDADIVLSGASDGQVSVSGNLNVKATGASILIYRGNPAVEVETSGASEVKRD